MKGSEAKYGHSFVNQIYQDYPYFQNSHTGFLQAYIWMGYCDSDVQQICDFQKSCQEVID